MEKVQNRWSKINSHSVVKLILLITYCATDEKQCTLCNLAGSKNSWNLDGPVHQDHCYLLAEALAEVKVEDEV